PVPDVDTGCGTDHAAPPTVTAMQPCCNPPVASVRPTPSGLGDPSRQGGHDMAIYAPPGQPGSLVTYANRYDNWIGGQRLASLQTCLSRSTTSATSPVPCARRRALCPSSTQTPSPTTSTSRWAWSARSFPGTSPCSWPSGSWRPPLPRATASSSNPPSRHRP